MHFDHERIPERVVHARGTGAHGRFRLTESLADVTCARVLSMAADLPGIVVGETVDDGFTDRLVEAMGWHRHWGRPPAA